MRLTRRVGDEGTLPGGGRSLPGAARVDSAAVKRALIRRVRLPVSAFRVVRCVHQVLEYRGAHKKCLVGEICG